MTASRGFAFASAALLALWFSSPAHAVIVLAENFDDDIDTPADPTDAAFTKSDADGSDGTTTFFSTGASTNNHWGIFDPGAGTGDFDGGTEPAQDLTPPHSGGVPGYTGFSGSYLVNEGPGAAPTDDVPFALDWSNLDITGLTSISFSGLFAATTSGGFESSDFIQVQYRINDDVGSFTELLWFSADADSGGDNDELALDLDFDGTGGEVTDDGPGTRLSTTAQSFTAAIGGTGTTLDLRILMAVSSTANEEIAFDSLMIEAIPEPSAFLFGGLMCGVIGLGYAGRRVLGLQAKNAQDQDTDVAP